jgi:hypothetical protein
VSTPIPVHPGPHAVYTGRATNWPAVLLTVALLVPLFLASRSDLGDTATQLVIGLMIAGVLVEVATASVRTAAGPNGVAIRFGVFGWPRFTCSVKDIAAVEVIDLPFWAVTFGYWWTPRRTCCTVRPGPTLRLTLVSGRTVTVTVPDPHAAVAALTKARNG